MDYSYYKKEYNLIACDLSKEIVLDSNPRATQQIEFAYNLDNTRDNGNTVQILTVLEKEKETKIRI